MDKCIYEILNLIESSGFEAYIVGGYVRDKLLGFSSNDVDIITNALPKDIYAMFSKMNAKLISSYGAVKIKVDEYNIDITTFRKEKDYSNNKPRTIEYCNDLYTDLLRRDFTINSICMDKNSNIIDLLDARVDLYKQKIYVIGDIEEKFKEDKSRILRAIRFMVTLNFDLDPNIITYIINNKEDLSKISYDKRKLELSKILISPNVLKFIEFVKKYDLEKYLEIEIKKFIKTPYLIGALSQIEFNSNYNLSSKEKYEINVIRHLVNKGNTNKYDIYKYGKYLCINAQIILKKSVNNINKMYSHLPIKSKSDIAISASEICEELNTKPSKKIGDILNILENEIINGKLKNDKQSILDFLKKGGDYIE